MVCGANGCMVKNILLSGMYDPDVRREVLGTPDITKKAVHDIIRIVEANEVARDAASIATAAATSSYKKAGRQDPSGKQPPPRRSSSPPVKQRPKKL